LLSFSRGVESVKPSAISDLCIESPTRLENSAIPGGGVPAHKEARGFGNLMEDAYGFSQAVRVGDTVYVSGQTAMGDDFTVTGGGDMAAQMRAAYAAVARVLALYGAGLADVVDEVLFVTDTTAAATCAKEVRAGIYGESFEVASTLIGVAALGSPDLMIEIKCVAHV
jgi:enamine deaminase RidA (YjgF/YER057c/UK114 family)